MAKRIVFPSAGEVTCERFEAQIPGEHEVCFQTDCSLMSTGTETIVYNCQFDPGTNWANWVKHPFYPGYSAVGHITAIGAGVSRWSVGERVVCRAGHASEHVKHESELYAVPDDVENQQAAWFALAKIAAMGAHVAEYRLIDSVLVIGAGPIGQMTVRWAYAAGATNIIVVDSIAERLQMAMNGGATHTIASPVEDSFEAIRALNNGQLTRVVVDTTGHAAVFAHALAASAPGGRVVLLGDTGRPTQQHLTSDLMGKGLTIIGAHDSHEKEGWNSAIIIPAIFELVRSGRFSLSGLNTHLFQPEQCLEAYTLASTRRGESMGILFDWSQS